MSISGERPPWTQRIEPVDEGGCKGKEGGCGGVGWRVPRVGEEVLGTEEVAGGRSAVGEAGSRSGAGEIWPLLVLLFEGGSRRGGVRIVLDWT